MQTRRWFVMILGILSLLLVACGKKETQDQLPYPEPTPPTIAGLEGNWLLIEIREKDSNGREAVYPVDVGRHSFVIWQFKAGKARSSQVIVDQQGGRVASHSCSQPQSYFRSEDGKIITLLPEGDCKGIFLSISTLEGNSLKLESKTNTMSILISHLQRVDDGRYDELMRKYFGAN